MKKNEVYTMKKNEVYHVPHHDSVGEVFTGKQTSSSKDYTHLNQLQEKTAC